MAGQSLEVPQCGRLRLGSITCPCAIGGGSSRIWGVMDWDTSSVHSPCEGGSTVGWGKFIASISLCLPIVRSIPFSSLGVRGGRGKDFFSCSSSSSPAQ